MSWSVFPSILAGREIHQTLEWVTKLREEKPFPGQIHPDHGTVRPQRLPEDSYSRGDYPLQFLVEAGRFMGRFRQLDLLEEEGYFLYYPTGTLMHEHHDPDSKGDHWRVGIVLQEAEEGGHIVFNGVEVDVSAGDAYLFRADSTEHAVTEITAGERIIWTQAFYPWKEKS